MTNIHFLKSSIRSAQGSLDETIEAIKNENIAISSKEVPTLDENLLIPYFLFQDEVEEDSQKIYQAIKDVVSEVISELSQDDKAQTALIVGTSLVDLNITEFIRKNIYEEDVAPLKSMKRSIDSYAKDIASDFGLNDYTMTIATACTSSANGVLEARNLLMADMFKYVVVVGVEVFASMMSSGFSSMKLLSSTSQKPFDTTREGLVLGEGIASILISKEKSPWSLAGGFGNCDSSTITSVSASGDEFVKVIENTLELSGLTPKDITALKAHATSTPANDSAEINAIKNVFDNNVVFTALKPYTGHTLGACGVLELAIFMACVDDGFIPKTLNHKNPIDEKYIPLVEHKECTNGVFMLNYFGFGGNNTSLIIQKDKQ